MKVYKLFGLLKGIVLKLLLNLTKHSKIRGVKVIVPLNSRIELDKGAVFIGEGNFHLGEFCRVKVRQGAKLKINDNFFMNDGSQIVCHKHISIGKNVEFGQNVLIFDHDHDYKDPQGLQGKTYKVSPVKIGDNVWIGANTIVLRGSVLEDNCIVGAGSIIKGRYAKNSIIIQKKEDKVETYLR